MFNHLPRENPRRSWSYVLLWTLFVYTCIPVARTIQSFVDGQWGREVFLWVVVAAILASSLWAGLWLRRQARGWQTGQACWLGATTVAFLVWTWHLRSSPEEALHFVQYGALSLLLYRALVHRVRDPGIYWMALLIGSLLGTLDEIIQWFTPGRFFDFRDIALNAGSGALTQIGIAKGIRPHVITARWTGYSLRWIGRLAVGQLFLLGLCASNTIERVESYASRIPGLDYLRSNESIMVEYGYRYDEPDIGVFYSRFTPEALAEIDHQRAAEVAEILNAYHDPRRYGIFLRIYTPATDPFTHEARVHLYRCDRYRGFAREHAEGSPAQARAYTVAFREQLIMERYFSNTLAASRYAMTEEYRAYLEARQQADQPYVSAVSSQLITRWRERHLWFFVALCAIASIAGSVSVARRLDTPQKSRTGT